MNMIDISKKFSKLNWEYIEQASKPAKGNNGNYIRRAKVPGGWLVESYVGGQTADGLGYGLGLTFIPDPDHKWEV